jgi:hypothetical protein
MRHLNHLSLDAGLIYTIVKCNNSHSIGLHLMKAECHMVVGGSTIRRKFDEVMRLHFESR